jgi:hypothetical protein
MKRFVSLVIVAGLALASNVALAGRGCDKEAKTAEPAKAVASSASASDIARIDRAAPQTPDQIAASRVPSRPMVEEVCDKCSKQKAVATTTQVQKDLQFAQTLRAKKPADVKIDKTVIVKNTRNGPIGRLLGLDKPSVKEKDLVVVRN